MTFMTLLKPFFLIYVKTFKVPMKSKFLWLYMLVTFIYKVVCSKNKDKIHI